MKYYKIDVELTTGFKYSYHCIERMKPGMVQSSKSIWTKSVTENEITKEEFEESRNIEWKLDSDSTTKPRVKKLESDKPKKTAKLDSDSTTKSETKSKGKALTKTPKLSSLEDFFDNEEDNDGRLSIPTKKTGRNSKADTVKKVRARRST